MSACRHSRAFLDPFQTGDRTSERLPTRRDAHATEYREDENDGQPRNAARHGEHEITRTPVRPPAHGGARTHARSRPLAFAHSHKRHTHARTHTYARTHTRIHARTLKRTNTRASARTRMHTHIKADPHLRMHAHAHAHSRAYARAHTHASTRKHAQTRANTRKHALAYSHAHTNTLSGLNLILYTINYFHSQGFSSTLFSFYRDSSGTPTTNRSDVNGLPNYDRK